MTSDAKATDRQTLSPASTLFLDPDVAFSTGEFAGCLVGPLLHSAEDFLSSAPRSRALNSPSLLVSIDSMSRPIWATFEYAFR